MTRLGRLSTRKALPSDKNSILRISKNIWGGKDYVNKIVGNWISDDSGEFILGLTDEEIVSFYHLAYNGDQSWMEALRVDVSHRRQGIATELVVDAMNRARKNGTNVIRLITALENTASRRLFSNYGFSESLFLTHRKLQGQIHVKPESSNVRLIGKEDLSRYFERYAEFSRGMMLLPVWWRWWRADQQLLDEFLVNGSVIASCPDGRINGLLLYTRTGRFGFSNAIQISFIDGSSESIRAMLSYLPQSQDNSGYFSIHSQDSIADRMLGEIGFSTGTDLVIMQKDL